MFLKSTPEHFLRHHWQKRPLLVRSAFPNFEPPVLGDDLAGLACEPEVEARLVCGSLGSQWQVDNGPLPPERFESLPEKDWTLLVQDVDKYVPEVAQMLTAFSFLPQWRIDDIMVSYSVPGGSVGPHTDRYDVFLIQGQGTRRWQWSEQFSPQLRDDCPLKMLKHFEPEHEAVLHPGDLLYLPPNVAHFGVALEPGLTFSVGFRSPSQQQLMMDMAEAVAERGQENVELRDPERTFAKQPTLLDSGDRRAFRKLLREGLEWSDEQLDRLVATHLTVPKENLAVPERSTMAPPALVERWASGDRPVRDSRSRFAHFESGKQILLFADGVEHAITPQEFEWLEPYLQLLPPNSPVECKLEHPALLQTLLAQGCLQWQSDELDSEDFEDQSTEE